MCGRYLLSSPIDLVRRVFRVDDPPLNLAPRWNIAPTTPCLVIRSDEQARRRFATLRWGLVPSWARDMSGASRMINARGETVAEKPAYREALRKRRCLVPADGFYEWPEQGEDRRPVVFRMSDSQPMAFAGLWESWRGPDAAPVETFTIVNTEARGAMRSYHHRVPLVLGAAEQYAWLDPLVDPMKIVGAAPFEDFVATRVSAHVNSVRNDDPGCVEPAGPLAVTAPGDDPATAKSRKADPRQSSLF